MKILDFLQQKKEVKLASVITHWGLIFITVYMGVPYFINKEIGSDIVTFWVDLIFKLGGN